MPMFMVLFCSSERIRIVPEGLARLSGNPRRGLSELNRGRGLFTFFKVQV